MNALNTLDSLIAQTETQLTNEAGDASLCQISKTGQPVNSIKYLEGRYAALKTAKRLAHEATTPDQLSQQLTGKWHMSHKFLARFNDSGPASRNWTSYYQGEIDAYAEALNLFTGAQDETA